MKFADKLIILGGGALAYQGTWDGLKQHPKYSSVEIDIEGSKSDTVVEQPQVNKTVQSQNLKMAEAVSDLSRATGDISLYGMFYLLHLLNANSAIPLKNTISGL